MVSSNIHPRDEIWVNCTDAKHGYIGRVVCRKRLHTGRRSQCDLSFSSLPSTHIETLAQDTKITEALRQVVHADWECHSEEIRERSIALLHELTP